MKSQTSSVDSAIEAAAQIPVRNVWYLLLYGWDMAKWKGHSQWASEQSPRLLGVLARVLAGATHELLRRQLGRAHAGRSETIQGVRGRVDFGTSLRRATFWHGAVDCAFSDPSVDTLRNRILLATLQALASSANLLLAYEQERENALRQELRSLARMLGSVSLVPISSSDFSRLQLGRNDRG